MCIVTPLQDHCITGFDWLRKKTAALATNISSVGSSAAHVCINNFRDCIRMTVNNMTREATCNRHLTTARGPGACCHLFPSSYGELHTGSMTHESRTTRKQTINHFINNLITQTGSFHFGAHGWLVLSPCRSLRPSKNEALWLTWLWCFGLQINCYKSVFRN